MVAVTAVRSAQRVGFIWGYLDLSTDAAHMHRGLTTALERLGVEVEFFDATPIRIGRPVYRWLKAIGKAGSGYQLRPEMIAAARLSGLLSRHRSRRDVDGWIHFTAPPLGRPAPGRYVTFDDMTTAQRQRSGEFFQFSTRRWARWNAAELELYRHAHACCTASSWSKSSLESDYGVSQDKIHVVGLGRMVDIAPPEQRDWSTPRFLFVGRDWRRKNGARVVRAFERLRDEFPAARLDLAGHHPSIDRPGVHGHGYLSYRDPEERGRLEALYQNATCFVLPSFTEPFAMAYLEAAGAGLPVIATTEGGIVDALGDDGALYVDPRDDVALYRAMARLAQPEVAATMGEAAQRNAAPYTWDRVAKGVLSALSNSRP
jgi:glycosyltransferase involved in cell wall biosynthesis